MFVFELSLSLFIENNEDFEDEIESIGDDNIDSALYLRLVNILDMNEFGEMSCSSLVVDCE